MKLGIIRGYNNEAFDYVKGMGLEFIESCNNTNADAARFVENKDSIKANIVRTGIPIASVGRWAAKPNVGGKLDEAEMTGILELLDAAADIGSPVFVCGFNYSQDASLFKNYCAAVEFFGAVLDRAKGKDIKVAVYNCDWENFVYRDSAWDIVLGELPELMIKYDCSHSFNRGQNYLAELSDWGDRVAHVHIKGAVKPGGKKTVADPPAGIDAIDWPQVFAILYARGYNGGLSLEPHSSVWRGDSPLGQKGIEFAINYIRPFIM